MTVEKRVRLTNPGTIVPLVLEQGDTLIIGVRDTITQSAANRMVEELDEHLPGIKVLVIQAETLIVKRNGR